MRRLTLFAAIMALFALEAHALTITAFKTGEERTGATKQCYYKFGTNRYTRTVRAYELCPLSIQVEL